MWVDLMTLHGAATSPVYLSNKSPYLDEYGAYYLAGHAREDLLTETHYYTPDELKPAELPPRSLLVVAVNEKPSPESLASAGWAPVKTVTEPTGQPVFLIYQKP